MPGTRKLSRVTSHRSAMLNNLVSSLVLNGKIETTLARAKEVKPIMDSLVDDKYIILVDELTAHEQKSYELIIKLNGVGHYHSIIKVSEVK